MRIAQVAGCEDQVGLFFLEQLAHDRHVGRADRVLAYPAGLIEWQVEEACILAVEPKGLDAADGFRLPDHPLEVPDFLEVDVTRLLPGQKRPHPLRQRQRRA